MSKNFRDYSEDDELLRKASLAIDEAMEAPDGITKVEDPEVMEYIRDVLGPWEQGRERFYTGAADFVEFRRDCERKDQEVPHPLEIPRSLEWPE